MTQEQEKQTRKEKDHMIAVTIVFNIIYILLTANLIYQLEKITVIDVLIIIFTTLVMILGDIRMARLIKHHEAKSRNETRG